MVKKLSKYIEIKTDNNDKKIWNKYCKKFIDKPLHNILPPTRRIIVIGDIHGDWDRLLDTLQLAGVINKKKPCKWIGGDTVVVQVGDQIDRTRIVENHEYIINDENSDIKILKYFTQLHNKALKYGGAVYSLFGNHELMNVMGDMRYVSPANIKDFNNYKIKNKIIKNGLDARKFAFKPGNKIAQFLACTRLGVLTIGSNLFVHAGIVPELAKKHTIGSINRIIRDWLLNNFIHDSAELSKILLAEDYSPFWTRIMGSLNQDEYFENSYCKNIEENVLEVWNKKMNLKIGYIFIGHTPTFQYNKSINSICNGKIWRTDIGLSKAFDHPDFNGKEYLSPARKPAVVEILNDKYIKVLHLP